MESPEGATASLRGKVKQKRDRKKLQTYEAQFKRLMRRPLKEVRDLCRKQGLEIAGWKTELAKRYLAKLQHDKDIKLNGKQRSAEQLRWLAVQRAALPVVMTYVDARELGTTWCLVSRDCRKWAGRVAMAYLKNLAGRDKWTKAVKDHGKTLGPAEWLFVLRFHLGETWSSHLSMTNAKKRFCVRNADLDALPAYQQSGGFAGAPIKRRYKREDVVLACLVRHKTVSNFLQYRKKLDVAQKERRAAREAARAANLVTLNAALAGHGLGECSGMNCAHACRQYLQSGQPGLMAAALQAHRNRTHRMQAAPMRVQAHMRPRMFGHEDDDSDSEGWYPGQGRGGDGPAAHIAVNPFDGNLLLAMRNGPPGPGYQPPRGDSDSDSDSDDDDE